jgi:hypothetical protein
MKTRSVLALAVLPLFMLAPLAQPASAETRLLLSKQQMLMVQGQPRFILGLYENPRDDAQLKEAVEAGFNLFQCGPTLAELDRVQSAGAIGWVNLGGALDLSSDAAARQQKLVETARLLSGHPALLVWEGPDELLWNNWWVTMEQIRPEIDAMRTAGQGTAELEALGRRARDLFDRGLYAEFEKVRVEFWLKAGRPAPAAQYHVDDAPARVRKCADGVTAGIRALRKADPNHAIWLNHAPRNSLSDLRLYNAAADMAGCDIYPVPPNLAVGHSDLPDKGITSVAAYTERMRQAAPGKACAMVLQGFGWRDLKAKVNEHETAVGIGRRPTWAESRFMAYDAIVHGANAILYWGTAYMKPAEQDGAAAKVRPPLWYDLLRVARELRALEPALVAAPLKTPAIHQAETYGSIDGRGVICTARRVRDDFVLLVVNETENGLAFSLQQLPGKLNGRILYRLYSPEEHPIEGGRLADGIKASDVQVYATSRRFEDPQARQGEVK